MVEWCLPPLRLVHLAPPSARYLGSPGLPVAALATDFDNADFRRKVPDVGAQDGFPIIVPSTMKFDIFAGLRHGLRRRDATNPVDEIFDPRQRYSDDPAVPSILLFLGGLLPLLDSHKPVRPPAVLLAIAAGGLAAGADLRAGPRRCWRSSAGT